MRKTAGFTLIELVIVIVILGILGAVAAPKFLNLQGDAYGANLNAVKSSMESAATLVNTKAILGGVDKGGTSSSPIEIDIDPITGVELVDGYPAATADGIIAVLDIKSKTAAQLDSAVTANDGSADNIEYIHTVTTTGTITVSPKARRSEECYVTYVDSVSNARPTITIDNDGC